MDSRRNRSGHVQLQQPNTVARSVVGISPTFSITAILKMLMLKLLFRALNAEKHSYFHKIGKISRLDTHNWGVEHQKEKLP